LPTVPEVEPALEAISPVEEQVQAPVEVVQPEIKAEPTAAAAPVVEPTPTPAGPVPPPFEMEEKAPEFVVIKLNLSVIARL
jgi:hypothetical protein